MSQDINVSVESTVEGDGASGKVVVYSIIGSLIAGLVLGLWIAAAWLRFEPSEEYLESQIELEVERARLEDSLIVVQAEIEEADAEAVELLDAIEDTSVLLDRTRAAANAHRARADSLQRARVDEEDVGLLLEENDALRASLAERELENETLALNFGRAMAANAALQRAVQERDVRARLMSGEIAAFDRALTVANAEIARASGGIGRHWYVPKVTIGGGCTLGTGCGPSVAVGISVNPLSLV